MGHGHAVYIRGCWSKLNACWILISQVQTFIYIHDDDIIFSICIIIALHMRAFIQGWTLIQGWVVTNYAIYCFGPVLKVKSRGYRSVKIEVG